MSDPTERITFELPVEWEAVRGSNGTRFAPPASPGVEIQVNTVDANSRISLSQRRDGWLEGQRRQGASILLNQDWSGENLSGLEYAHDAEGMRGEMIWHHILLEGDGYVVTTHLQAPPDIYEAILPVYREIVSSVRPE
ncbi:MAG: hypothetical protein GVY36_12855 [Verrucomicrobia bacterium]|nr:hypothetical protein [Verrucomicrobiota bacterium]